MKKSNNDYFTLAVLFTKEIMESIELNNKNKDLKKANEHLYQENKKLKKQIQKGVKYIKGNTIYSDQFHLLASPKILKNILEGVNENMNEAV